jgi:WD40-like Beta Propeller Repeat
MNCEQVEELLSAYLDDTLAVGETAEFAQQLKRQIEAHLQECLSCRTALVDFRRFDALLAHIPRVMPSNKLRGRIFSSLDDQELTGTDNISLKNADFSSVKKRTVPHQRVRRDTSSRPQLVALPGGRHTSSWSHVTKDASIVPHIKEKHATSTHKQPRPWGLWMMQATIAAAILLTLGVGSLIGRNIWLQKQTTAVSTGAITPPAGLVGNVPLAAGMHFVFLRDGALWSTPSDGSTHAVQLTPRGVSVAANWVISPPLAGRDAGDMLAYIDLQQARVHTVRSDGLRDTLISLPLLKASIAPSSVWDTNLGEAILTSLTWSKDGSMLAFIADPTGTGSTSLYILSIATGSVQVVPSPSKGNVTHPLWSPDGIRVAFEVTQNSTTSILDYNTQNHGMLVITNNVAMPTYLKDEVLNIAWTADTDIPAITWSVGVAGHVHSIWLRYVGVGGSASPRELVRGDYVQATYSVNGHSGIGSWLLVSMTGQTSNLFRLDAVVNALSIAISSGKHISFAQWSPDGVQIDYLDNLVSDVGTLHIINVITGVDTLIGSQVTNEPAPAWSKDSQQLIYSTGVQTIVVNTQGSRRLEKLKLRGMASVFVWSATSVPQVIVALSDGQTGVYLVDTQHNMVSQVDTQSVNGPVLWAEIP